MALADSRGSRLLPWEDVDGHLCPRTPWVLMHWRSRRAACPPRGQQHTPRTHCPGTLTASVALTLKVCSDPGGRGLDPAQPQCPAPGLAEGCPDLSPTRNHTTFTTGLSPIRAPSGHSGSSAKLEGSSTSRLGPNHRTQGLGKKGGFEQDVHLSVDPPVRGWGSPGVAVTHNWARRVPPMLLGPERWGVSCCHHVSLLVQEGAEGLLGILLCHPCWAVQHSHPQNTDQGLLALPKRPPGPTFQVSNPHSAKK